MHEGREEVKEQHKIKWCALSANNITRAFESGKKEALQKHRDTGFNSFTPEEQTEIFHHGKTDKIQ